MIGTSFEEFPVIVEKVKNTCWVKVNKFTEDAKIRTSNKRRTSHSAVRVCMAGGERGVPCDKKGVLGTCSREGARKVKGDSIAEG